VVVIELYRVEIIKGVENWVINNDKECSSLMLKSKMSVMCVQATLIHGSCNSGNAFCTGERWTEGAVGSGLRSDVTGHEMILILWCPGVVVGAESSGTVCRVTVCSKH
jgi:hypothetical protein